MEPQTSSQNAPLPKRALQRLWQGGLSNLFAVGVLSVVILVGELTLSALPGNPSWVIHLHYWQGYPWLPALIASIGLVSFAAAAGSSFPLKEWATNPAIPGPIRFVLTLLSTANPGAFSAPVWWAFVVIASASLVGLWRFPRCIRAEDILVSFLISKGEEVVASAVLGETVQLDPSANVKLQAEIEPVSRQMELPVLECAWVAAGDGQLDRYAGCIVNYQSGQDDVPDPISMQLTQWHCPALEPYPFFVARRP